MPLPDWAIKQREDSEKGITPTQSLAEMTAGQELGEITDYGGDFMQNLRTEVGLAFEPNPQAQADIVRQQFPDARVEYDPDQDAVLVEREGDVGYINKPGLSQRDFTGFASLMGLFSPAARAFSLGATPAAGAAISGGAGFLTEGVRQLGTRLLGSEQNEDSLIPGTNLVDMGMAGVTQMLPDFLIGRATQGARHPGVPPDIASRIDANMQALETSGLNAMRGQIVQTPYEQEQLKVLGQLPETSMLVDDQLQAQNQQAQDVVSGLLEDIGYSTPADPAQRFKSVTDSLRGGMVEQRREATEATYQSAFGDRNLYETEPLQDTVDSLLQTTAPGSRLNRTLTRVRDMLGGPRREVENELTGETMEVSAPMTLEQMQDAKVDIDADIEKALADGNNALAMRLGNMQDDLLDYMHRISPEYTQAREVFAELSKPINEFDESVLGYVARMEPRRTHTLADYIFNPRIPENVRGQAQANIESVDPNAFRELALVAMRGKLDTISDVGTGGVENVPYKINNALFKNQAMRDMWKQAFPEYADDIDALHRGLKIQSTARNIGSPTATREQVVADLSSNMPTSVGQAVQSILGFFSGKAAGDSALGRLAERGNQAIRTERFQEQVAPSREGLLSEYGSRQGINAPWLNMVLQAGRGTYTGDEDELD